MHYRTFLDLFDFYGNEINASSKINIMGMNKKTLEKVLKSYDLIIPKPLVVDNIGKSKSKMFEPEANILNLAQYPDLYAQYEAFQETGLNHYKNTFIMSKEAFFEYCEKIFGILLGHYNKGGSFRERDLGYHAEYLSSFFYNSWRSRKENNSKCLEVDYFYIEDFDKNKVSKKYWENYFWTKLFFFKPSKNKIKNLKYWGKYKNRYKIIKEGQNV